MKKTILSPVLALSLCLGLAFNAAAYDTTGTVGTYTTISAGMHHAGAIDQNGSLWMWGANEFGQLGNPNVYDHYDRNHTGKYQSVPAKILDNVVSVNCTEGNTAVIKTDGSLWMWGSNSDGQLGVGGNEHPFDDYEDVPVKVMDGVAAVSCGHNFTAIIKTDGSLWMCGINNYGELGNGGVVNAQHDMVDDFISVYQSVPVKILDNVVSVSCGYSHSAAIKTDGSLWMWGNGELGNGGVVNAQYEHEFAGSHFTVAYQSVPLKIMDGVAAVSCQRDLTTVVKTDGSLWVWGDNLHPVKVLDGVATVQCGVTIKTDGSLWTWEYSQGKIQYVPLNGMDGLASVSFGDEFTVLLKTDGSLWTRGSNHFGLLGNGGKGDHKNVFGKIMDNIKLPKSAGAVTPASSGKTAQPTNDALISNGALQTPTVYKIDGSNCFKIRDLAAILNGTEKQFSVSYDTALKAVTVTTGQSYKKLSTDLAGAPAGGAKIAQVSSDAIYINGQKVDAQVYKIDGNNYFKLRDLGKALNFYVGWTKERGVYIETNKPYQD